MPFSRESFLVAQMVKDLPAMQKTRAQSLGREDPLEKGKTTHSSMLAWRIPWREECGRRLTLHRPTLHTCMNGLHLDPQTSYPGYHVRLLQLYHSDANEIKTKNKKMH